MHVGSMSMDAFVNVTKYRANSALESKQCVCDSVVVVLIGTQFDGVYIYGYLYININM